MEINWKESAEAKIEIIKNFIIAVEQAGLTNEQWFLDFEDQLNALSIKDHTIR